MTQERELSAEEVSELNGMLPEAWRLLGIDPAAAPSPRDTVSAVNEFVGRARGDGMDRERAIELSFVLGALLGEQWRTELGWQWRLVTLGRFQGYGVVSADRRFVYFAMNDLHHLLIDADDELNLLLLFNMAREGTLSGEVGRGYVSLG